MMNIKQRLITGMASLILLPVGASAYYSPEDVLLNKELFLPPTAREADERVTRQTSEANARREREQDAFFAQQEPVQPEPDNFYQDGYFIEELHGAAPVADVVPTADLNAIDLELARTLRLLDRLDERQRIVQYGGQLHSGAPLAPLAPTGAGGMLAGITMLTSVVWTVRQARKAEKSVQVVQ